MRGSWRPNITAIYWPPLLWPSALCPSRSPGLLNRRPRGPALWWMMAFFTTSYQQLVWTPTHQGSRGPLRRAFFTTSCLLTRLISNLDFLSWLIYIIVQRPLNHPLNLWNGMFDRHHAEITVMQFRGHSLTVYPSMSVWWDFLPCPISSAKPAYAISFHNCHWNVSLPSGASPWNGKFGQVEGQNTTSASSMKELFQNTEINNVISFIKKQWSYTQKFKEIYNKTKLLLWTLSLLDIFWQTDPFPNLFNIFFCFFYDHDSLQINS